jgi:hypothetical protein
MALKYSHKSKSQTKFGFYSTGEPPILFILILNKFSAFKSLKSSKPFDNCEANIDTIFEKTNLFSRFQKAL